MGLSLIAHVGLHRDVELVSTRDTKTKQLTRSRNTPSRVAKRENGKKDQLCQSTTPGVEPGISRELVAGRPKSSALAIRPRGLIKFYDCGQQICVHGLSIAGAHM